MYPHANNPALRLFSPLFRVLAVSLLLAPSAALALADGVQAPTAPAAGTVKVETPGWIAVFSADQEPVLRSHGVPIWGRDGDHVIASAEAAELELLAAYRIDPVLKVRDTGQWINLLIHDEGFVAPSSPQAEIYVLSSTTDLWLVPREMEFDFPRVKPHGGFMAVPRLPLAPVLKHPADEVSGRSLAPEIANPLVTEIVNNTSQALWFQDVKDMSGENTVVVGGNTVTISTRYTRAMFLIPTPVNALATEYILEKAAGWGYTGVRETYTSTDSGCSQVNPSIWQNVIFTLPGQVDFGQHQQVIFVTHYDSLSSSATNPLVYAPGADDAISGGSALFEALRLFGSYGFKNTVKIIFFSGEEQGLCGSVAYTRQHPSADMWRVVNMDQTAYDGDLNRLMDCYNWSVASSPQSVALGDSFVQANLDYGTIIPPANIQRPTNKMCQTDHCPFWNVGVAAIAITEDLFHNDISPCFDFTDTPACHDTVTQVDPNHPPRLIFTPDYSWLSEKAAIATVAHLAEPLYACPASAPTPVITAGNTILHVSWPAAAGVTNYVLEKASSCAGPFIGLTSVTGTIYDDTNVVNGTSYAYRIRTCPNQVSTCVTASPQAGPSVIYQTGSAVVTGDTGDHDNATDNCELVTARVTLLNDGNTPLTGVKLAAVSSSHPGVQVVSFLPQTIGALGVGASAPASFRFYLGRNGSPASCGDAIPFTVTVSSDQSPTRTGSFSLGAEKDTVGGPLNYGFETDMSGWTVTAGSFTRTAGGSPGSTFFSLRSRNMNSDCNAVESPIVIPTASSGMTMWVNYGIEAGNFDRAVVRAIDTITGIKTLLTPTGATYNTTGCGGVTLCDNLCNIQGWSGAQTTWRQATFNLASFAGVPIKIEVRYSTDTSALGTQGFWFDNVQITNATQITCDAQTNSCAALPTEVSPIGEPVQFTIVPAGASYTLRFSEVPGATSYNLYGGTLPSLHTGAYNHASLGGLCGLTDGSPGDGQVVATVPVGSLAQNSYLLAVARGGAGESSIYGTKSTGATIPVALAACP